MHLHCHQKRQLFEHLRFGTKVGTLHKLMLSNIVNITYLRALNFIKGIVHIKITDSYLSCRLYSNVSQQFKVGAGQKLHGNVHHKQCAGSPATYNSSYRVSMSHIGDP
jgi:hypothetical protein